MVSSSRASGSQVLPQCVQCFIVLFYYDCMNLHTEINYYYYYYYYFYYYYYYLTTTTGHHWPSFFRGCDIRPSECMHFSFTYYLSLSQYRCGIEVFSLAPAKKKNNFVPKKKNSCLQDAQLSTALTSGAVRLSCIRHCSISIVSLCSPTLCSQDLTQADSFWSQPWLLRAFPISILMGTLVNLQICWSQCPNPCIIDRCKSLAMWPFVCHPIPSQSQPILCHRPPRLTLGTLGRRFPRWIMQNRLISLGATS